MGIKILQDRMRPAYPPKCFYDELKRESEDLKLVWDGKSARWEIYEVNKKFGVHTLHKVFRIQNKDGSYRKPDNRVIDRIRDMDTYEAYGTKDIDKIAEKTEKLISKQEQEAKEARDKKQSDDILDSTKDDWRLIKGNPMIFTGSKKVG